jgi:hypothetical protein
MLESICLEMSEMHLLLLAVEGLAYLCTGGVQFTPDRTHRDGTHRDVTHREKVLVLE